MTTAREIITSALEDVGVLGVGQTPLAEDVNFGLVRLNRMIGQFNRRRWLVFHLMDVACTATGNASYTVGTGASFDIPRPDKLENGCFYRLNGIDYPLTLLESREDYSRVAMKNLGSWPSLVYYDAAMTLHTPIAGGATQFPCGNLLINPVPASGQGEIHLLVKDVLGTLANLSTVLLTPPEYEEAFEYNLALRFCAKYQIDASKEIAGLARAALSTIRSANTQVPLLQLPAGLVGTGRRYNIFSDRSS
jgi:hypothetical protein